MYIYLCSDAHMYLDIVSKRDDSTRKMQPASAGPLRYPDPIHPAVH